LDVGVEMPLGLAEKTKQYSVSKNVLYPEAIQALVSLGFQVKSDDVNSGTIKASKGVSIWSRGQTITIIVSQSGEGSKVFVQSRENYQLIGYLQDQKNVNKIINELDSRLAHLATGNQEQ
jgi:hypothetical protein